MRRLNPRVLFAVGIPVVVIVLLLAAWAIDSSRYNGKVPRNVKLAGREIGGMTEDRLAGTVADIAAGYATLPVQVRAGGAVHDVKAADLGLRLDEEATVDDALGMNGRVGFFSKPIVWLSSFASHRSANLKFTVDQQALDAGVKALEGNTAPEEPKIVVGTEGLTVVAGTPGRTINSDGLRDQLLERARSGETPIVIDTTVSDRSPTVPDAVAQDFANRINAATANGLLVKAGRHEVPIDATTVRSWLGATIGDGEVTLTIDEATANEAVTAAVPVDGEVRDAGVTLVDGRVQVTPAKTGETCCAADTATRIRDAIDAGENRVEIPVEVKEPSVTDEDVAKLGIKEPVGSVTEWAGQPQVKSFTTYYAPGEPRVTNIHKIADDVRGTLVKPGEQFSMNDVVGQRTAAKGYVPAGAIANGEHVEEVGGGVSQFATTMFNAVYFAGLRIDVYQAHSEHFSRYPRGREATMGFPAPDLKWTNNSPYGVLVWTSYTDTSVTVTLYSTQWATAEQTGSVDSRSGKCTVVTTTRTIHYADGRTGTDTFSARYRDKGETSC
mgnify:CR=1 FL=1